MAVERETTPVPAIRQNLLHPPKQRTLVEARRALQRRSLIERQAAGFVRQNVIIEYVADRLVETGVQELEIGELELLHRHALLKAQTKEYVHQSQVRLILTDMQLQGEDFSLLSQFLISQAPARPYANGLVHCA